MNAMKYLLLLCLSTLAMPQSYYAPRYPWCTVVDFTREVIACISSDGHLFEVPNVDDAPADVLLAELPNEIAVPFCRITIATAGESQRSVCVDILEDSPSLDHCEMDDKGRLICQPNNELKEVMPNERTTANKRSDVTGEHRAETSADGPDGCQDEYCWKWHLFRRVNPATSTANVRSTATQWEPTLEPADVPAIQEGELYKPGDKLFWSTRWTCADKSRILLVAENGTRHCLKF
jgi:hypothetical protein